MTAHEVVDVDSGRYTIRAVDRTCDILEILARASTAVALPDIADACGLPKSSAFRYLSTLENRRFVERTADGGSYRLGSAMRQFGGGRIDDLISRAHPLLETLRDEFGETANLGRLEGAQVAYLDIVESLKSVRLVAHAGTLDELHCTALGKAIIAAWPADRVRALIGETYPARTPRTVTSWPELSRELEKVTRLGYAIDDEENELGGRCVAVAIPGLDAAISVSAPVGRMPYEKVEIVGERLRSLVVGFIR